MKIKIKEDSREVELVENEYVVYAIEYKVSGYCTLYSYDKDEDGFLESLVCFGIDDFEVIDNRISKYWIIKKHYNYYGKELGTLIAFPEWANDPYFYECMVDHPEGEKAEAATIAIFLKYKELMDKEFD